MDKGKKNDYNFSQSSPGIQIAENKGHLHVPVQLFSELDDFYFSVLISTRKKKKHRFG